MSVHFLREASVLLALLVVVTGGGAARSVAQPDSVRAEILTRKGFSPDHSPRNALLRAVVVPGWGQVYNRQYYKVPFVYAGFAALGFRLYRAHRHYKLFQRAHLFGIGRQRAGEIGDNAYQQYEDEYNEVVEEQFVREGLSESRKLQKMREQRDQFRRRRDLTFVGTGIFYALTVLDAYVSAHLLTFDVGETLNIRVHPMTPRAVNDRGGRAGGALPASNQSGPLPGSKLSVRLEMRF